MDLAESNIFGMLFGQGYRKKEYPTVVVSLTLSNSGFDPTNFITKAQADGRKKLTWTTEEKGKVFTVAIGGSLGESKIESKSHSLASMPLTATSYVSVSNSNKMNSSAFNSSHSFPSK